MSTQRNRKQAKRGNQKKDWRKIGTELADRIRRQTPEERSNWSRFNVVRLDAKQIEDTALPLLRTIRKLTERYADGSADAITQAECIAVHRLAEVVEDYLIQAVTSLRTEAGPQTSEAAAPC